MGNDYGSGQHSQYSDTLRAGQSEDRIPMGAKFFALVQAGLGPKPPTQKVPGLSRGKAAGMWR